MPTVARYTVVPKLPPELEPIRAIAGNLWWCWDPEAVELFFRIDRDLWVKTNQNPCRLLGEISQLHLEELAEDDSFRAHLDRVYTRLQTYLESSRWREKNPSAPEGFQVAYLSAEYGLQESMSIYSGGLGVLAGDYLKAASDLGLPLVGVGLLYREGYFRQYLNADGWQQEEYVRNDFYNMPIGVQRDAQGKPLIIEVPYPDRTARARIWRCQVGRVPLYLLDSDCEENNDEDRAVTARLYGGDQETRIRQEIMLGVGGCLALRALGIAPTVWHMNEGHSAFMTLQRVRELVAREGISFEEARDAVRVSSVFTTHTPVPAGNDVFPPKTIERYFDSYIKALNINLEELLALGRQDPKDAREPFCMTVLALKLSAAANGVSKLHGTVARGMWSRIWTGIPEDEVPITSITNGVHTRFWISRDLAGLYDRYLGPGWVSKPDDHSIWERIDDVPDAELWRTHERRRERLVNFSRRRLVEQLAQRGAGQTEIDEAMQVLDPEILTIGFARRFATYKRATLLLRAPERFAAILTRHEMPVQLIFAGKAHPADHQAKELVRNIIHFARNPALRSHIVFIEDYDMNVARYMVQGVDCWLNTPRRPLEASGTSGMKAAANGGLNISIPDGWWCEAEHLGENGWSIGQGESYADPDDQDNVESEALYEILEKDVVPMFYDRGPDGLPRRWINRMKTAIRTICPVFSTNRMVQEYAERFYIPCTIRRKELRADGRKRSLALTAWKKKVQACWDKVHFKSMDSGPTEGLTYGSSLQVTAEVFLDQLTDQDVAAEIYYGDIDPAGQIAEGKTEPMECTKRLAGNMYRFEGAILCDKTGQQGFTVRVTPSHPDLAHKHETALIQWA